MEIISALFFVLTVALLVALFVARPFFQKTSAVFETAGSKPDQATEHRRSSLLAERDRILTALQELEFDYTLGKVPEEDYPLQRAELLKSGAAVLRELDQIQPEQGNAGSVEDRIAAAVAARRADAAGAPVAVAESRPARPAQKDAVEDLIASRRRKREEKSAGFCPRCGKPVMKSDKFCARCGATL